MKIKLPYNLTIDLTSGDTMAQDSRITFEQLPARENQPLRFTFLHESGKHISAFIDSDDLETLEIKYKYKNSCKIVLYDTSAEALWINQDIAGFLKGIAPGLKWNSCIKTAGLEYTEED